MNDDFNSTFHRLCTTQGRSLARQLRNGTAADRDRILRDLRSGKLVVTDLTTEQVEHVAAACLVGLPRSARREAAPRTSRSQGRSRDRDLRHRCHLGRDRPNDPA